MKLFELRSGRWDYRDLFQWARIAKALVLNFYATQHDFSSPEPKAPGELIV